MTAVLSFTFKSISESDSSLISCPKALFTYTLCFKSKDYQITCTFLLINNCVFKGSRQTYRGMGGEDVR